jgi:sulfur carrier protein
MKVVVNGQERHLDDRTTVARLLERLEIPADGVAVAIGRTVVPRTEHPTRMLTEGDEVEVVRAVGGG